MSGSATSSYMELSTHLLASPKAFYFTFYFLVSATKVAYEGLNLETLDAPRQQGHIPGAINVQSSLVVDEGTNCFLPKDELKKGKD